MKPNSYRAAWAAWLPAALAALAKDPPDFKSVMPHMPLPELEPVTLVTPPPGPLGVTLLTSSGAYDAQTQAPFVASSLVGDPTHRMLDATVPAGRLRFAHEHFDHAAAAADLETIVPRRSVRVCGAELAPHIISWTGYVLDWPTFIEATIPQIVKQVQVDRSNAAVLVPL